MDLNKLAVFANQVGGTEDAAELLGTDSELIDKAIEGDLLTSFENAQLENAFNQIYLNPDIGNTVDFDSLDSATEALNYTERFLDDSSFADIFRAGVADGLIDPGDLTEGYGLFANLTHSQSERITDLLQDESITPNEIAESIREMFAAYEADGGDIFGDIEESEFWEWFRETFYE